MKERLDVLLVKRNLAESREKAKAVRKVLRTFIAETAGRGKSDHYVRKCFCGGTKRR